MITDLALKKGTYSATDIIYGNFKLAKAGIKPKKGKMTISVEDFAGKIQSL